MPIKNKDIKLIGEYVVEEYQRRKRKRADQEKAWKDIDRQVAMTPDISHRPLCPREKKEQPLTLEQEEKND